MGVSVGVGVGVGLSVSLAVVAVWVGLGVCVPAADVVPGPVSGVADRVSVAGGAVSVDPWSSPVQPASPSAARTELRWRNVRRRILVSAGLHP